MAINYNTQQSYGNFWDKQPTQSTPNPFPTPYPPPGSAPTTTYQPGGVSPFSGLVKQAYAADNGGSTQGTSTSGDYHIPGAGGQTSAGGGQSYQAPSSEGSSGGGSGTIANMVAKGGYDQATAEQVYNADPGKFETEFGSGAEAARIEAENRMRGEIEGGYSDYFSQLDAMMNEGLPGQRASQEGIARSQFEQGQADLGLEKQEGMSLLEGQESKTMTNQDRNLKSLAENIRNSMQATNVFLGSRGAGDSSAVGRAAAALTKMGTKARTEVTRQTGDIMAEIGQRKDSLQRVIANEGRRLKSTFDSKVMEVANWFAEAQNKIRSSKAEGSLQKGRDLATLSQQALNSALNELQMLKQEESNNRSMLNEWAANQATMINQAQLEAGNLASFSPVQPQSVWNMGSPQFSSGGDLSVQPKTMWSSDQTEEKRLFG